MNNMQKVIKKRSYEMDMTEGPFFKKDCPFLYTLNVNRYITIII